MDDSIRKAANGDGVVPVYRIRLGDALIVFLGCLMTYFCREFGIGRLRPFSCLPQKI